MKRKILYVCAAVTSVLLLMSCYHSQSPVLNVSAVPSDSPPVEKKQWTLMIYMAADNDLDQAAVEDFKEIENAVPDDQVSILVLADRFGPDGAKLYSMCPAVELECPELELQPGSTVELNMASPLVLSSFIQFCKENYPAEHYGLVLWGHGTGVRCATSRSVAVDDTSGTVMPMTGLERAVSSQEIDVLGFDTCFGTTLEQLYQLQSTAAYLVGSPGLTSVSGWDYTRLCNAVSGTPQQVAEAMVASCNQSGTTAYVCEKLPAVFSAFESFAESLASLITDEEYRSQCMNRLLSLVQQHTTGEYPADTYLDVYSLASCFAETDVISALDDCAAAFSGSFPGCSVFFTTVSSLNVAVPQHPALYIKNSGVPDQCDFVKITKGWCPTRNHEEKSFLDRLFYSAW